MYEGLILVGGCLAADIYACTLEAICRGLSFPVTSAFHILLYGSLKSSYLCDMTHDKSYLTSVRI